MSRSVTRERSVITWDSPYATFSWILTRCLIAAEFVLPFSVGVNISLFLSFCLLFSLVPTCTRLKIPNHQPSQQGLSSRASHSGELYSRSVSDMVLQAFGFHPSGKGTRLIPLGALYRQTPISATLVRSLMFLVWDCLALDADAMAWSATHICKPS